MHFSFPKFECPIGLWVIKYRMSYLDWFHDFSLGYLGSNQNHLSLDFKLWIVGNWHVKHLRRQHFCPSFSDTFSRIVRNFYQFFRQERNLLLVLLHTNKHSKHRHACLCVLQRHWYVCLPIYSCLLWEVSCSHLQHCVWLERWHASHYPLIIDFEVITTLLVRWLEDAILGAATWVRGRMCDSGRVVMVVIIF